MKILKRFALWCALLVATVASAQDGKATWSAEVSHIDGDEYQINVTAKIDKGYHIYDANFLTPTTLTFTTDDNATLVGEVVPLTEAHVVYDDIFMMDVGTYEGTAEFAQKVKLNAESANVNLLISWQACDDAGCHQGEQEMNISLPEGADGAATAGEEPASEIKQTKDVAGGGSLWSLIIEAVLWGFAALLTPCVFPMVPMTVSYFLKGEGGAARGRLRAALYGLFIVLLYTLPIAAIIIITRVVGGDAVTADIFNWLATHWLPNILFFLVFMVFAASFFGAFEITMPSWLVNKSDSKADTKGLGGIFFLALTLVLVSFSCTGPIVGSVLIKSTSGEFWTPIITMLAFSLAFALPFTIFAFFPSMLKSLPKSGGWLNSVKVVIGFIEVALGLKFLSVADQTYHWGLLDREVYLAIWIVVFALMGLYLMGKIKFAHDSDVPYLGVGRLTLVIVVFSFVVYLIPGMWGAPLKALSGYLPPMHTQDYVLEKGVGGGVAATATPTVSGDVVMPGTGKYSDFLHLPHGLQGFFDLKEAEAYAAKVGKPIFIDFTGHGCVNCREMEARVWADPEVLSLLKNEYVVLALYADDKKILPEEEWVTTENGKVLKGLGKINSHYALETYGVNAQPYYVLQNPEGEILTTPMGRNLDVKVFADFLRKGVEEYKARK